MEFSRPEYSSGELFPSPGDLPNSGIKPRYPPPQADSLPAEPQGKPKNTGLGSLSLLQGIFLIQQLNRDLLHCREILYQLRYQVRPISLVLIYNWKFLPFDHFQAIPCPPTSYPMLLVATNLISFLMSLFFSIIRKHHYKQS